MTTTAPGDSPATRLPGCELFGRDHELQTVRALLADHRLVTITGPGGVGKTRLAREVAEGHTTSDVSSCELAPVPDSGGVPTAVADALGFPSVEAAAVGLTGHPRLLLVDNAEHHLDAVAQTVGELLAGCPELTVLATSQEALDLPGERVVVLDALQVPAGDDPVAAMASPAVRLFVARARAAGADLPLDAATAAALAAICRRLDGLPLAIELAAARARSLAPDDILQHLDARFELLTRRRDRGPARHRSLEATIGWSYERLDPATQRFLARLGAFCGPFPLQAAHTVAAEAGDPPTATIDRLDALVHRSLVAVSDRSGPASYRLPESVRLYARRRLEDAAEAEVCDERCVDHYVDVAEELTGRAQRSWSTDVFHTLLSAQLNLQDAIRWCQARDSEPRRAFTLFVPLWGLVHNGRAEPVHDLGGLLLERWPDPDAPGWAPVAATTATAALVTGHPGRGGELATRVLATVVGGMGRVLAARAAYLAAVQEADHAAAMHHLEQGIATAEADRLEPFATELHIFRALAQARTHDAASATATAALARHRADAGDSPILHVFARLTAGVLAAGADHAIARRMLQEALSLAQPSGYPWGIATGHRALGALALITGDLTDARAHLERSLETFVEVGQLGEAAGTLRWIAAWLVAAGRPDTAARVCPPELGPPIIDVLERAHLDRLLAGVTPSGPIADLRPALLAARTALAEAVGRGALDARQATAATEPVARWVREGAVWALTYDGATVRLPATKGLADLAVLLSRPGREVPATELMGAAVDSPDLGPVIDTTARRAYERRIIDLQQELDEAESFGDLARAERARGELDQLVDALAAATGIGGRSRRPGDSAEKARSAVTRRIRDVIRRIADLHPTLGDHLIRSVRTGRWCAYQPEDPVAWTVQPDGRAHADSYDPH